MKTSIPCPTCAGYGTVPLKLHLQQTLTVLKKLQKKSGQGVTPAEIHEALAFPGSKAAMNGRLNNLVLLGLATKAGTKPVYYRAL